MDKQDALERMDFTPRKIEGEELDRITDILKTSMTGYVLAQEVTDDPEEQVILVSSEDIAPSWEEMTELCKATMTDLGDTIDEDSSIVRNMDDKAELRLYLVRPDGQENDDRPLLAVVDWTNGRVVGFG